LPPPAKKTATSKTLRRVGTVSRANKSAGEA
jgi:hypothetical protein